jgi:hypothetical protein
MMTHEEQTATQKRASTMHEDRVPLQTIQRSFQQICEGESPWIPLGIFMHQFFGQYKHRREELVSDPLQLPEHPTPEQFRWAVFCAASVEYLCGKYTLPCPEWALRPFYSLEEPWYYTMGPDIPRVREKLRKSTPEEFARRNIFCGDRIFQNKYEYQGRQGHRRIA